MGFWSGSRKGGRDDTIHFISFICFSYFPHSFFLVCMFGASLGGLSRSYIFARACVDVLIYIFVRCASAWVMSWYAIRGAMGCKEG
jgi:hypothetical protein